MCVPDRDHEEEGGHPGQSDGDLGVGNGSVSQGTYREYNSHEPDRDII